MNTQMGHAPDFSRKEFDLNQRRARLAQDLRDLLAVVNSGKKLDEILLTVCEQASELLGTAGSQIFMPNPELASSLIVRAATRSLESEGRVALPLEGSAVGLAFQHRRPVTVCDGQDVYEADPRAARDISFEDEGDHLNILSMASERSEDATAFAEQFGAVLMVPLVIKEAAHGVLALPYRSARSFSGEEISLALAFADQAAMAVENARLHEQAAERTVELESLLGVSRAVASTLDLDELVRLILLELQNVVDYSAASLILIEDGALVVHDLVAPGKTDSDLSAVGVRFPLEGLADAWQGLSRPPWTTRVS